MSTVHSLPPRTTVQPLQTGVSQPLVRCATSCDDLKNIPSGPSSIVTAHDVTVAATKDVVGAIFAAVAPLFVALLSLFLPAPPRPGLLGSSRASPRAPPPERRYNTSTIVSSSSSTIWSVTDVTSLLPTHLSDKSITGRVARAKSCASGGEKDANNDGPGQCLERRSTDRSA